MAIEIAEEKKQINWVAIITTIIIIAVLFVGSYYLFFKNPELIEVVAPQQLKALSDISKITLDVENTIQSPLFKLLKQFAETPPPQTPGKSNPFRPL